MEDAESLEDVEGEIQELLAGTKDDKGKALLLIDQHFRLILCGSAKRRVPSLSFEEMRDLWGKTLAWFWSRCGGDEEAPGRPVIPLLRTYIVRRGIELRRREVMGDRVLRSIAHNLANTDTGSEWQRLSSLERWEVQRLIRTCIKTFPTRQKLVLGTWVDGFPATQNMKMLRQIASDAAGEQLTMPSVQRALQEGRKKLREDLRRRSFNF